MEACFAFLRLSFQLCAILCLYKITLFQKQFPREVRHFMRETLVVLSRQARAE
jgi:hypothetical protein